MTDAKTTFRILFLLACITTILPFLSGCSDEKKEDLRPQAWAFMIQKVTEKLGNPIGLTFPADGVSSVTPLAGNRFQITSSAEYSGPQGEKQHSYFYGTVVLADNTWSLEELKFSP